MDFNGHRFDGNKCRLCGMSEDFAQSFGTVCDQALGMTAQDLELKDADENLAFFGCLFAMAAADGQMDSSEIEAIFDLFSSRPLSPSLEKEVRSFLVSPPEFDRCLDTIARCKDEFRYGLFVALTELAMVDNVLHASETALLDRAQSKLGIGQDQRKAIEEWEKAARETKLRGSDDRHAEEALKSAAAGLAGVGVPIGAVYLSGSVVGLSAAGITSGLVSLIALSDGVSVTVIDGRSRVGFCQAC